MCKQDVQTVQVMLLNSDIQVCMCVLRRLINEVVLY